MKEIKLEELPKSDVFMKHVKLADDLTKESNLEHGFTFCLIDNEIVVDKICAGTECVAKFDTEICGDMANTFHTHTIIESSNSQFSVGDIYRAIQLSYALNEPYITCVKDVSSDYILCIKIYVDQNNKEMFEDLWLLYDEFNKNKTYETQEKILKKMYIILNPESISFHKNVIYIPLNTAWEMRAKWAYPGDMSSKRTDITMARIESGMRGGRFDPIFVTCDEFEEGVLTEGKHRLIIAKKLGIKQVPIVIT